MGYRKISCKSLSFLNPFFALEESLEWSCWAEYKLKTWMDYTICGKAVIFLESPPRTANCFKNSKLVLHARIIPLEEAAFSFQKAYDVFLVLTCLFESFIV